MDIQMGCKSGSFLAQNFKEHPYNNTDYAGNTIQFLSIFGNFFKLNDLVDMKIFEGVSGIK